MKKKLFAFSFCTILVASSKPVIAQVCNGSGRDTISVCSWSGSKYDCGTGSVDWGCGGNDCTRGTKSCSGCTISADGKKCNPECIGGNTESGCSKGAPPSSGTCQYNSWGGCNNGSKSCGTNTVSRCGDGTCGCYSNACSDGSTSTDGCGPGGPPPSSTPSVPIPTTPPIPSPTPAPIATCHIDLPGGGSSYAAYYGIPFSFGYGQSNGASVGVYSSVNGANIWTTVATAASSGVGSFNCPGYGTYNLVCNVNNAAGAAVCTGNPVANPYPRCGGSDQRTVDCVPILGRVQGRLVDCPANTSVTVSGLGSFAMPTSQNGISAWSYSQTMWGGDARTVSVSIPGPYTSEHSVCTSCINHSSYSPGNSVVVSQPNLVGAYNDLYFRCSLANTGYSISVNPTCAVGVPDLTKLNISYQLGLLGSQVSLPSGQTSYNVLLSASTPVVYNWFTANGIQMTPTSVLPNTTWISGALGSSMRFILNDVAAGSYTANVVFPASACSVASAITPTPVPTIAPPPIICTPNTQSPACGTNTCGACYRSVCNSTGTGYVACQNDLTCPGCTSPTLVPTLVPTIPPPTPIPPTPVIGGCSVTTSPTSLGVQIGSTSTAITANVTLSGGAVVSKVDFGAYDTATATVNVATDTIVPYATAVTGRAVGFTAVWATVTLTNGLTCSTPGLNDTDVNVTALPPTPTIPVIILIPTSTPIPTVIPSPTPIPPTATPTPNPSNVTLSFAGSNPTIIIKGAPPVSFGVNINQTGPSPVTSADLILTGGSGVTITPPNFVGSYFGSQLFTYTISASFAASNSFQLTASALIPDAWPLPITRTLVSSVIQARNPYTKFFLTGGGGDVIAATGQLTSELAIPVAPPQGSYLAENPAGAIGIVYSTSLVGVPSNLTNSSSWYVQLSPAWATALSKHENEYQKIHERVINQLGNSTPPTVYSGHVNLIGNSAKVDGVSVYETTGSLTISSLTVTSPSILFVNGDVNITGIANNTGSNLFALFASGDITVDKNLGEVVGNTDITSNSFSPHLRGVYFASGTFDMGGNYRNSNCGDINDPAFNVQTSQCAKQLRIDGTVIGMTDILMNRNHLGDKPAIYVNFNPSYMLTLNDMGLRKKVYQELLGP